MDECKYCQKQFKRSSHSLGYYCCRKCYGLGKKYGSKQKREEILNKIKKLYLEEMNSIKQVGKEIGKSYPATHEIMKQEGIPKRNKKEACKYRKIEYKRGKDHPRWNDYGNCTGCGKEHKYPNKSYCMGCYHQSRALDREIIHGMWKEGKTDKEISKSMGTHEESIGLIRRTNNWKSNRARTGFDKNSSNMKKHGVDFKWSEVGALRTHPGEKEKHYFCKALVSRLLAKNGKQYLTEVNCMHGVIDVYNLTDKIIIELETQCNDKKRKDKFKQLFDDEVMNDFFIFDLKKEVPDDYKEAYGFFANKLGLEY